MPHLNYFVVCESSIRDSNTQLQSFINVLDDIFSEEFPFIIPEVQCIALWHQTKEEMETDLTASVSVDSPGRETYQMDIVLDKSRARSGTRFKLLSIPVDKPGALVFRLHMNGECWAEFVTHAHNFTVISDDTEVFPGIPVSSTIKGPELAEPNP